MSPEDYRRQLIQLTPQGKAWPEESSTFGDVMLGLARSFSRAHIDAAQLLDESLASRASTLLDEWEYDHGLPDDCAQYIVTTGQRKAVLLARVQEVGDQSRRRLHDIAAKHGETIVITEFDPGDTIAGHPEIATTDAAYAIQINLDSTSIATFKVGKSRVGEPLRWWSAPNLLKCEIERHIHAHKTILWTFNS